MPTLPDPMPIPPFQLLELNIISAQDLFAVSRSMRAYAVAWVRPDRKLTTRVDTTGQVNPTWNDKFVFRVDDSYLRSETSSVTIDLYAVRCFRDVLVGTVRILISNLFPVPPPPLPPPPSLFSYPDADPAPFRPLSFPTRFMALQVRRPSGRPQGILNIGVALLDGTMRSMPIYTRLTDSSGIGFRDLMGELNNDTQHQNTTYDATQQPGLRRTKSHNFSEAPDDDQKQKSNEAAAGRRAWSPLQSDAQTTEFEVGSSVLEGWSEASSVEGLRSKLERWRAELPPIYDKAIGSFESTTTEPTTEVVAHRRRNTDGGSGLFSCFGDSFGCECSIFCGLSPKTRTNGLSKIHVSTSDGNLRRPLTE